MRGKINKVFIVIMLTIVMIANHTTAEMVEKEEGNKDQEEIGENYQIEVKMITELGIMKGYEDKTFRPSKKMTRAEFAKVVYKITKGEEKEEKQVDEKERFVDVSAEHWAKRYIEYCQSEGYIQGKGNQRYDPEGKIKLGEVGIIIDRIMPDYEKNFKFESTYEETNNGEKEATREEIAKELYESIYRRDKKGKIYGENELGFKEIKGIIVANDEKYITEDKTGKEFEKRGTSQKGTTRIYAKGEYLTINEKVPSTVLGEGIHFMSYPTPNGEIGIGSDLYVIREYRYLDDSTTLAIVLESDYDDKTKEAKATFELLGNPLIEFSRGTEQYSILKLPENEKAIEFEGNKKKGTIYHYELKGDKIDLSYYPSSQDISNENIRIRNGILYINGQKQWISNKTVILAFIRMNGRVLEGLKSANDAYHQEITYEEEGEMKKFKVAQILNEPNTDIVQALVITR